eukprot:1050013-Prymnesium_polylepis.1
MQGARSLGLRSERISTAPHVAECSLWSLGACACGDHGWMDSPKEKARAEGSEGHGGSPRGGPA